GVVPADGLGHEELRPDAVRRDGDAQVRSHRNDVGEEPDVEDGPGVGRIAEGRPDPAEQGAEPRADGLDADIVLGERRHRPHPPRRAVWGPMRRGGGMLRPSFAITPPCEGAAEYRRKKPDRKG